MSVVSVKSDTEKNFRCLKSNKMISSNEYGVKSATLNNKFSLHNFVNDGLILSIDLSHDIANDLMPIDDIIELKNAFNEFKNGKDNLILRSSSSLEWLNGNSFSGLFKTLKNIKSYEDFINAIKVSYIESHNEDLINYAELKSVSIKEKHLGFLLQKQVKILNSCLLFVGENNSVIEFFQEDIENAVSGKAKPIYNKVEQNGFIKESGTINTTFLNKIEFIIEYVRKYYKNECIHFEIGFDELDNLHILQINELGGISINDYIIDSKSKIFISKYESMLWFNKVGLFNNNLKIYSYFTKNILVEKIIQDFQFDNPITVRFSYNNQINLPRGFFKTKEDLSDWVSKTKISSKWKAIVHDYINVRRSFELLLDKEVLLLEHIPGMWESDNILNPDVILLNNETSKSWIWNERRNNLKFEDSSVENEKYENVTSEHEIIQWQTKLSSVIYILKEKFAKKLPLNFHFVENDKKEWSFLNIRSGFDLDMNLSFFNDFHIIENFHDLDNWDGKKQLHLKISTERNYENKLLEIVNKLPNLMTEKIVVDFGILSHPAMILREYGYNLIPSYFIKNIDETSSKYITKVFDINNDPIKRIFNEKSVFEDNDFKIVRDKNPIVENHLLIVSKLPYTSMSDFDNLNFKYNKVFDFLKSLKYDDNFVVVERGRAKFCTSGFTDSHAHAHILPLSLFRKNVLSILSEKVKAIKVDDIKKVIIELKKSDNEYLLFMTKNQFYYVLLSDNRSFEKQLIRKHFSNNIL